MCFHAFTAAAARRFCYSRERREGGASFSWSFIMGGGGFVVSGNQHNINVNTSTFPPPRTRGLYCIQCAVTRDMKCAAQKLPSHTTLSKWMKVDASMNIVSMHAEGGLLLLLSSSSSDDVMMGPQRQHLSRPPMAPAIRPKAQPST